MARFILFKKIIYTTIFALSIILNFENKLCAMQNQILVENVTFQEETRTCIPKYIVAFLKDAKKNNTLLAATFINCFYYPNNGKEILLSDVDIPVKSIVLERCGGVGLMPLLESKYLESVKFDHISNESIKDLIKNIETLLESKSLKKIIFNDCESVQTKSIKELISKIPSLEKVEFADEIMTKGSKKLEILRTNFPSISFNYNGNISEKKLKKIQEEPLKRSENLKDDIFTFIKGNIEKLESKESSKEIETKLESEKKILKKNQKVGPLRVKICHDSEIDSEIEKLIEKTFYPEGFFS